jgi:hypothetical protein
MHSDGCTGKSGQGATEYLVLLAVVLIVALISVALLGFFPGMASDAQITQSQTYWQSASPVAVVESAARTQATDPYTRPYIMLRNTGAYPIRITGIVGVDGNTATQFYAGGCGYAEGNTNLSDIFYLAPGEQNYISPGNSYYGTPCTRSMYSGTTSASSVTRIKASSVCQNSTASPGTLDYKTFGFEYIEYIDGQQITKRQIGKELLIKCREPF